MPFGWDNEFGELPVDVPAFTVDRHNVTNAEFLAFVEAGGYEREALWTPAAWAWRTSERRRASALLGAAGRRSGTGAACSTSCRCPPAWPVYVSHAEAEAFARWRGDRLMTEAEYHRAAFGTPDGREQALPWGDAPARPDARQLRRRALGSRAGRLVPAGRERVRRARSGRQRLGVDVVAVRAVPGVRADAVVSRVLRRLLRRRALRAEGRVAGDARRARAPQLPQLVPPALPVCLRHVPLRASDAVRRSPPFAEDVRAGLLARPKRLPALWFYDALGSALFEAICRLPWYRITRSESALLARHAGVDRRTPRGSEASFIELGGGSGEKLAILIDAAVRRAGPPDGAPGRRLGARARSRGGHAVALRRRARHDTRGDLRSRPAARSRPPARRTPAGAVSRLEHRELRSARTRSRCCSRSRRRCGPATSCCSAPIS